MMQWIAIVLFAAHCLAVTAPSPTGPIALAPDKKPLRKAATQFGVHGGERIRVADGVHCEVVFAGTGIRLFVTDNKGRPVDVKNVRATAVLRFRKDPRRHRHSLFPETSGKRRRNVLYAPVELGRLKPGEMKAIISLRGLPTKGTDRHELRVAYRRPLMGDRLAIHLQRTCPVTGKSLHAMGRPVKVALSDFPDTWVCCNRCQPTLKKTPAKFLTKAEPVPSDRDK